MISFFDLLINPHANNLFLFPGGERGGRREERVPTTNNPYIPNRIGEIKSPKANVKEESE